MAQPGGPGGGGVPACLVRFRYGRNGVTIPRAPASTGDAGADGQVR
jgi:hypothetical protein